MRYALDWAITFFVCAILAATVVIVTPANPDFAEVLVTAKIAFVLFVVFFLMALVCALCYKIDKLEFEEDDSRGD